MFKRIVIQTAPFDMAAEFSLIRQACSLSGAIVSFTGLVRGREAQATVESLWLEHYPGMTEATLHEIACQAGKKWQLDGVTIIHRVGQLQAEEMIVLVLTASAHRAAAFAACDYVMDVLKTRAEFWKKEQTPGGARWVDAKASDHLALSRWLPKNSDADKA